MLHPSLLPSPLAIGPQHLEKLTVQSAMGSRHDPRHYCRQLASTDVWETTLMQPPDDRCSQLAHEPWYQLGIGKASADLFVELLDDLGRRGFSCGRARTDR